MLRYFTWLVGLVIIIRHQACVFHAEPTGDQGAVISPFSRWQFSSTLRHCPFGGFFFLSLTDISFWSWYCNAQQHVKWTQPNMSCPPLMSSQGFSCSLARLLILIDRLRYNSILESALICHFLTWRSMASFMIRLQLQGSRTVLGFERYLRVRSLLSCYLVPSEKCLLPSLCYNSPSSWSECHSTLLCSLRAQVLPWEPWK